MALPQPGPPVALSCLLPTRQQELDNLLQEKRYLRALGLAISLDRPHTVLTVIQGQCCLRGQTAGGSLGSILPLPWGSVCPPPTAIRRDPEACEKLEATVFQLRRDQKGPGGRAGGG